MSRKVTFCELSDYLGEQFTIQFNGDWKQRAKFETVFAWCVEQFGPMALERITDSAGHTYHMIDSGEGTWIATGREFWFRDPDHATIFRMVWC